MKSDLIDDLNELVVPDDYQKLWDDINLSVQTKKGESHGLFGNDLDHCLSKLSKRAYYLVTIAEKFNVKNIAEVGTAEGWQFYSFAKYAKNVGGFVWSCDIRDVRNEEYVKKYSDFTKFVSGKSDAMRESILSCEQTIDMFYIDGWHERGWVLNDIEQLRSVQSENPIWVFDDYDERFGCSLDIDEILESNPDHYIYNVGNTASNQPNHQAIVFGKL